MKSIVFVFTFLLFIDGFAQCSGGSGSGAITPTAAWQTITVSAGSYYTFTVSAGTCDNYDFSFCQGGGSASYDSQITILDNSNVYANGYSDDACGLQSQVLAWSPAAAGTYRVLVNNYYCSASGATATLAYRKNSPGNNANYQFLGNAFSSGTCITLTSASNDQRGCAWDVNSTLNFASNFSYDFTVNLGSSDAGADGIAFVMQNDPQGRCECGVAGGSMGAGGITNSLTVEIDTYLNAEDRDDGMASVLCAGGPEPDHLDIWLNGVINPEYGSMCVTDAGERIVPAAVPLMIGASIYNIENGANHILRISWNAGTSTLTASVLNVALSTTYGTISYSFNPVTVFGTNTPYFGFTASTGGLNNQQTYCLPNVLLPVELISFYAECDQDFVKITWNTASEMMNQFFYLERSSDGINYEEIAKMDGAGTSNHLNSYVFYVPNNGNDNYYRLLQSDINGNKKVIGGPLSLSCKKEISQIMIYPNPANDLLMLNWNGVYEDETNAEVLDISGKIVYTEKFPKEKTQTGIDVSGLAEGVYFVRLYSGNSSVYVEKLVITR